MSQALIEKKQKKKEWFSQSLLLVFTNDAYLRFRTAINLLF